MARGGFTPGQIMKIREEVRKRIRPGRDFLSNSMLQAIIDSEIVNAITAREGTTVGTDAVHNLRMDLQDAFS